MHDQEQLMSSYVKSFALGVSKPHFSTMVTSSGELEQALAEDMDTKLMLLGAFFVSERYDDYTRMAQHLDFSDLESEKRLYLVYRLFYLFTEEFLNSGTMSPGRAGALLELLSAVSPESVFAHTDLNISPRPVSLIELAYSRHINRSVSGVIFTRETQCGPGSRKQEFGYRMQSSLASQGWDISLLPLQMLEDYSCHEKKDFVIIDAFAFASLPPHDQVSLFLARLKRIFRKIIMIDLDPWTGLFDKLLRGVAEQIDYIWGFTPEWGLLAEDLFRGKSILFPNVGGLENLFPSKPSDPDWSCCTFNFTGSVQGYNLNRAYWILEFMRRQLPIDITITSPGIDDGLDCQRSLQLYAHNLLSTHASLNLTTRTNRSRMLTGRTIEIISLNRLLIQEYCPAVRQYYVEGEHFLEFTTIEELCTVIEFLKTHPKVAQRICFHGNQFYTERYSCRKMVEHIQTLL